MGLQFYIYNNKGFVKLSIYQDKIKNKMIFDKLYRQRNDIEREIGFLLEWVRNDENRESIIRKEFVERGLDYPDTWSVLQEKMTDTMVKFEKAFRHRLQSIV